MLEPETQEELPMPEVAEAEAFAATLTGRRLALLRKAMTTHVVFERDGARVTVASSHGTAVPVLDLVDEALRMLDSAEDEHAHV